MRRVQFNLTGFKGLQKTDAPVLRLNFPDPEEACAFHALQVATDSEVQAVKSGVVQDGVAHDLWLGWRFYKRAGGIDAARRLLQRGVVFTAPVANVMEEYDHEGVVFTGEFNDEASAVEALVSAAGLQKSSFEFTVQTTPGVVQFLRTLAAAGDAGDWVCRVDGPHMQVAKLAGGETRPGFLPVGNAVVLVPPLQKRAAVVSKIDFAPFPSASAFSNAIDAAVRALVRQGAFGMAQYRLDDGTLEEVPPSWWHVSEIGNDWLVVTVELQEPNGPTEVFYRLPYRVTESGAIEIAGPFERVERAVVWVGSDEEVVVRPVGAPTQRADEPQSEAAAPAEPRTTRGFPTRKFSIVKTDMRPVLDNTEEKRYVLGVVLEPNDGVDGPLNPDTQGDVYSAADIEKAAHRWMSDFLNLGVMHVELAGRRVLPVESYIAPVDMELNGQKILRGSWLLGAILEDPELWQAVKSGQLTGWSMGGFATREPL